MTIIHPIYGRGTMLKAARGVFHYVKFTKHTNVSSSEGENVLAVSLNVCRRL